MKVSDHLTWLAEAIIDAVVHQAWVQMVARYGQPKHLADREGRGFAVVGYGKLGGWELGYSSDLDLIFLHDCPVDVMTDGEREIDGRQFYLRLAQRIMHLFSTRTSSGILYEVDARLRPSGAAGMLVTSTDAFADYQQNEAWTWEHQALVRARVVYGDPQLKAQFDSIRRDVLTATREGATLQPKFGRCARRCAPIWGINTAIALISKPTRAASPTLNLLRNIWCCVMRTASRS